MIKRIAFWIAGVVLSLLMILSGIIYLKKDEIIRSVQEELNRNLHGEFTYSNVGLSFFSTFPQIGIGVDEPVVTSDVLQQGDTLISARSIHLTFDLWDLLSGSETTTIREVMLEAPDMNIRVDSTGRANYDLWIAEVDTAVSGPSEVSSNNFQIDYFSVSKAHLTYRDWTLPMEIILDGLNFETSGTLGSKDYTFELYSNAEQATLQYDGIRYIDKARLEWDGDWNYTLDSNAFSFNGHRITLNALELGAGGKLVLYPDYYDIQLSFNTPGEDIRQLFSLIPAVYAEGMDDIKTGGTLALNSTIEGQYGPNEQDYPSFELSAKIVDGSLQFEHAENTINQIQARLDITKPQGNLNQTRINLPTFSLRVGEYPLKGSLFASNLVENPNLSGDMNTDLDLSSLEKALPKEGIRELKGHLRTNLSFDFSYDQIEQKDYENIQCNGNMRFDELGIHTTSYPRLAITLLTMDLSPSSIKMQIEDLIYGQSDLSGTLLIRNPLLFYFHKHPAMVEADLSGSHWLIDEWLPAGEQAKPEKTETTSATAHYPLAIDLKLNLDALDYDTYHLTELAFNGSYRDDQLKIEKSQARWQGSTIKCQGELTNIQSYVTENGPLTGQLNITTDRFRVDDFYKPDSEDPSQQENAQSPETRAYVLPEAVDLNLRFASGLFEYGQIRGTDLRANLSLSDQVLEISDAGMEGLGGQIEIAGVYNTQEANRPLFDFKYELSQLEISSLFSAVETFGLFVPIGKRIRGRLNSSLVMSGALDNKLSPVYDALDASGQVITNNATLPELPLLNSLDDKLGFNVLNNTGLKDLKTWFNIEDGRLNVNEFPFQAGEVKMTMKGSQYLDQSMDYTIHAVIPKEMISSTQIGREAERGFEWVRKQSAQAGIPMEDIDEIELDIHLTGELTQPNFSISFAGASGTSVKEKVKSSIRSRVDTVKQDIRQQAEETLDTVRETIKDKARDIIKEQVKGGQDTTTGKNVEDIKKKAEQSVDSLKNKIKNWNPFKNKKKNKNDQ